MLDSNVKMVLEFMHSLLKSRCMTAYIWCPYLCIFTKKHSFS